jgi:hypothetical protein
MGLRLDRKGAKKLRLLGSKDLRTRRFGREKLAALVMENED